ncbi:hypothetical protein [Streptomyces sp. CBMA123]|uniref:hypothetical protein n=1 Tax=Streptomyces sp. CBMA123 TaxID=1896313 RepID=UPI001661EA20|nr:hypothetical protein [Streptomyces sp. CBMA123]MBD0695802.1 hypothetical protein [Streptomyces sp. CBMA123]
MTWKCVDCTQEEKPDGSVRIDRICHHCGKPLCAEDQVLVHDPGFSPSEDGLLLPPAVHCKSCKQAHHPRAAAVDPPAANR